MESVLARYRNLIILVGVLFLQVLGLAVQVKLPTDKQQEKTRLIRIWAVGAITPFERGVVWIENSASNVWRNYFYLRGVRTENRQLKEQIEQMRLEQVRLSQDAAQAHRLQALLSFKEQFIAKTVAAQVIGWSGGDQSRIVWIDKGEDEGLKRDMPVITADGIVGKVLLVYKNPSVAQVLLINDQTSGVGVILEKSRLQGVLRGTANGEVTLEKVMSDEQVSPGETVLTSGGDQIFPKGLPVGTVTNVGPGKDLFQSIKVRPAANLSKLEEVLVLVEKQQREVVAEGIGHVRAADILAARLPSVPDKPAQPADAAPGAASSANPASGVNTSPKPAGTATAQPATKKPATAGSTQVVPPGGQPGKTAKPVSATQKPAAVSSVDTATSKPLATPTKPADQPPAEAKPSTQPSTPPDNSQTAPGESSPN
jgi:rod shape-determining protein MreC